MDFFIKKEGEVTFNNNLLNRYPSDNLVEIIQDSSNSDKNNVLLNNINSSNNTTSEDQIQVELDKVEILESINGSFIVKQKKNDELNSESSEINSENLDALENTDDETVDRDSI